ncbi:MAG: 2-phospho-L-lactate guanylyltransferase [Pseudomonadota bacterium]
MKTLIAVPMKDPAASKTRLTDALSDTARTRLVHCLYRRTLDVLSTVATTAGADLAVITASPSAAALAKAKGVRIIPETGTGLCAATTEAARTATIYDRLCVIPADLAAPAPEDFLTLLSSTTAVTVCPSTDQGTNALLVSPPDAIRFQYGPRSALRHLQEAEARGLTTCLLPLDSLSFDIDTSPCLTRAIRSVPEIAKACA